MKLYVGNLSFKTTIDDLRAAVEQYAPVTSIDVVVDRMTGQSRGFAFVEVGENGEAVIQALNGAELQGRELAVSSVDRQCSRTQPSPGHWEMDLPTDASESTSAEHGVSHLEFVDSPDESEDQRFATDWAYAYRHYSRGDYHEMQGHYVGIFREHVIAVGESDEVLRQEFAEAGLGTPEQLVVLWIDQNDIR